MSTGQHPKRRETDQQADRRVAALERRRTALLSKASPVSDLELMLLGRRPRLSAGGRLAL